MLLSGTDLACRTFTDLQKATGVAAAVDAAARRVLRARLRMGHFDQAPKPRGTAPGSPTAKALARRVGAESVVLLKNNGVLPLNPAKLKSLAVFGAHAGQTALLLGETNYSPSQPAGGLLSAVDVLKARLPRTKIVHAWQTEPTDYRALTIETFRNCTLVSVWQGGVGVGVGGGGGGLERNPLRRWSIGDTQAHTPSTPARPRVHSPPRWTPASSSWGPRGLTGARRAQRQRSTVAPSRACSPCKSRRLWTERACACRATRQARGVLTIYSPSPPPPPLACLPASARLPVASRCAHRHARCCCCCSFLQEDIILAAAFKTNTPIIVVLVHSGPLDVSLLQATPRHAGGSLSVTPAWFQQPPS